MGDEISRCIQWIRLKLSGDVYIGLNGTSKVLY